jgi:hypothetical protein
MAIWDGLREKLDKQIKRKGVQNAYFPLLIPVSFLSKEAEHVEGFAKECAVVTHHRLRAVPGGVGVEPDPDAELEEPLIVRPTSETIIWHMFGRWITSYRDLPLKVNQWANVLRWELRTRPFLRSAEFLWQEGHTAHASAAEADALATDVLDMYATLCEDELALPVVKGAKSASERFAGAEATYTIEGLMQNGWALQCGTSHFLGQNFAKAFDVRYQTKDATLEHVWATSWGVTTRLIGALVMSHSDDAGARQRGAPRRGPTAGVGAGADGDMGQDGFGLGARLPARVCVVPSPVQRPCTPACHTRARRPCTRSPACLAFTRARLPARGNATRRGAARQVSCCRRASRRCKWSSAPSRPRPPPSRPPSTAPLPPSSPPSRRATCACTRTRATTCARAPNISSGSARACPCASTSARATWWRARPR